MLGAQWCFGLPTLLQAVIWAKFPALVKQQEYSVSLWSVLKTWPIYLSWLLKSVLERGTVFACLSTSSFVMCEIMLTFMSNTLLRWPACHAFSFLSIVGVIQEYSSPYRIIGLNICLKNLSFIFCGMLLCFQNNCNLLNVFEALPSLELRFGSCEAVWLHKIPRYVAVFALFTGDPSLNEIVVCSISGLFIVTNTVLSRFNCIPNVSECVSILCNIVFINLVDLPNSSVSSAYSKSIRGSLAVCVWD